MGYLWKIFLVSSLILGTVGALRAQEPTPMPTFSDPELEKERQKLLLERMKLENEKMKFEAEKAKIQVSPGPVTVIKETGGGSKEERAKAFQGVISSKAEGLSAEIKDDPAMVVFDFVNSEVWHHGVRYQIHTLEALGKELNRPMKAKVKSRLPTGYPRNLYSLGNISLLRYQGRDRGIFEWVPPQKEGEFGFRTPEGISGDSSVAEIRNTYHSDYFEFEWQREEEGKTRLRYKHTRDLAFDDKLEFLLNRDGKILKIRYGVLDEH